MRKPSPAMIVALVALFVALGGAGMAATGGNFILGHANSATKTSSLSAPVAGGKALQLTNNNTSNAASTALGLNVAGGHAPFSVNSAVKVANLNADTLDGVDSSALQRLVSGNCSTDTAVQAIASNGSVACSSAFLTSSAFHRFGLQTIAAGAPNQTLFTAGQLSFIGICMPAWGQGQSFISLQSSADHAAFTGTASSALDLPAGGLQPVIATQGGGGQPDLQLTDGVAVSADGHQVFFTLLIGQHVGGATGNDCVVGGSFIAS
jgi:hypothetical protein